MSISGTVTCAGEPLAGAEVFAFAGVVVQVRDWHGTNARFVESAITDVDGHYTLPTGGSMLFAIKWDEGTPAAVQAMIHDAWAADRQFMMGRGSRDIDMPPAAARPNWFVMKQAGS